MAANPARFFEYYGLNLGLGIATAIAYAILAILHSVRKRNAEKPFKYTKIAAVGTFCVSVYLIGWGAAMMVATDFNQSDTITVSTITADLSDIGSDPFTTFEEYLPDANGNQHLLLSEASIQADWVGQ